MNILCTSPLGFPGTRAVSSTSRFRGMSEDRSLEQAWSEWQQVGLSDLCKFPLEQQLAALSVLADVLTRMRDGDCSGIQRLLAELGTTSPNPLLQKALTRTGESLKPRIPGLGAWSAEAVEDEPGPTPRQTGRREWLRGPDIRDEDWDDPALDRGGAT